MSKGKSLESDVKSFIEGHQNRISSKIFYHCGGEERHTPK